MMSFKKNLFTVLLSIALVLIGCWLVKVDTVKVVEGMILVIATMVMTLLIEDFWRKALTAKELLTWQYFIGAILIGASVLGWLWSSEADTMQQLGIRLGATFLCAVLGAVWMAIPYRNSIQSKDERDKARVERFQARHDKYIDKIVIKAGKSTKDEAVRLYSATLRYRFIGDDCWSGVDYGHPIALLGTQCLTLDELKKSGDKSPRAQSLEEDAVRYIGLIVDSMKLS
jgi:hypothetical protein